MIAALEGKTGNYLYGIGQVARFRPKEAAHLLRLVFDKGDLNTRLAALRTLIFSEMMGSAKMIGDLFVKLMGATTREERRQTVEPFIENILHRGDWTRSKAVRGKLAWLKAYYHGWKSEQGDSRPH